MNTSPSPRSLIKRVAAVCAAVAALLALMASASWWMGGWRSLTLGAEFVPMAPSTGLLLLFISAAAFLQARWPGKGVVRSSIVTLASLALGGSLVLGLQYLFGFSLPMEAWLAGTSDTVRGIPVGRMSPLTAACFVATALALLGAQVTVPRLRPLRTLAGGLALAVLIVSGIVLAGYGVGSPFLYGGATIPMAVLTAIAFVLLSAAIILAAGSDEWPLRMFIRRANEALAGSSHQVEWSLLMLFLVLAGGITLVGVHYLNGRQAAAREAAHQQLEAIAELKVQQIANWRKERLTDANLIRSTPYAARRALDALAQPDSSTTRSMFTSFLAPLLAGDAYERVLLLDSNLQVRLVHPQGESLALAEPARRAAEQALRTREVVVADLHQDAKSNHVHMSYMVPLVVRREGPEENVPAAGSARAPGERSAGVLILQLDAQDFLFPLIQRWPMPSRTAETLLVRKEGNEVVFVNDLRHRQGTALTLRRSLTEARLPAAMGLRGERAVVEGEDYRGVPVVAATRPVPDSPWLIVSKVDKAELYAPLRQEAMQVGAVALALLSAAVLGVTVLWRRGNEQLLRAQLVAEQERRTLAERFEHLMKSANDAILLTDEKDHILEFNDRALVLYGYPEAEFRELTLLRLRPAGSQEEFARRAMELATTGQAVFETAHRRKDGSVFPVEVSSRLVDIGGQRYKLGILRDITQRKAHEAEIERLNRLYATLSQVNQTVVRCQTREELFNDVCRVLIEFGQFRAVWIGWKPGTEDSLTTVASQTRDANTDLAMPGWKGGCGIIAEVLRTGRAYLCNDAQSDPRASCCRETLARLGVQTCAAFPLHLRGEVRGVFSLCSLETGFSNAEETRLLEEVTADISFALDKLDKEARRQEAEARLRFTEFAMERISDEVFWVNEVGRIEYVNAAACQALGYAREELLGLSISDVAAGFPPDAWPPHWQELKQAGWLFFEARHRAKDGRIFPVEVRANYLEFGGRAFDCGFVRDISERKEAERERALLTHTIAASVNEIYLFDAETWRFRFVSAGALKNLGYTLEQLRGMTPLDLKPAYDRRTFARVAEPLLRREKTLQFFETVHRRANGSLYPVEVRLQLFEHEEDRVFLAVIVDTTERKRLEQERTMMEARLRQQQKLESIGTLASGVAHEINNPITGIMNYAQLIQDRLPAESPLTEFTGEIMHETQRVAGIVRNLLTFARNEKQSHSPARLVDIVEGTLSLIRTVIRHDQITLNVKVADNLPQLKCRSQQIQQVLMNLMTNARDALNERYPQHDPDKVLNLEARLFDKEGRRFIRVTVEDHGTGITPEVRERMFDPFFTTKPRDVGTGLGLSISHGIVKEHHGELTVESEPGKFTRMQLDLPVDNGWGL